MEVNQEVSVQFDGLSEASNIYKKATDILSKWDYVTIGELQDMYPRVHMEYDRTAENTHFTAVHFKDLNDATLTFSAKEELDIPALIHESFDNISRASRKYDIIQDLKKAQTYLGFAIEALEKEKAGMV